MTELLSTNMNRVKIPTILLLLMLLLFGIASAEVRTLLVTGEYRMAVYDTAEDAKHMALLDAKRLALEQAGTYVESITQVKNLDLTRAEMKSYTAGIVEVVTQTVRTLREGSVTVVRVDAMVKIDTDDVSRQIEVLRKNESARAEILRLNSENDRLWKELEAKTQELYTRKSPNGVEELLEQRRQLSKELDFLNLLNSATIALASSNDWIGIGSSTVEGRNRARELLDRAFTLYPTGSRKLDSFWHSSNGILLVEEGDPAGSARAFRNAIRLQPNITDNHANLGGALAESGDLEGAIVELHEAIRLEPNNFVAHMNLGYALLSSGELDAALAEYKELVRLRRDSAVAHGHLGGALYFKGDLDAAIAECRKALRLDPELGLAHVFLGGAFLSKGDLEIGRAHV